MSVQQLLDPARAQTAGSLAGLNRGSWASANFTYLIWDTDPLPGWLPPDHPIRRMLTSDRWRPLYLGKAAGWSSVARHLSKDLFGARSAIPTDKNAINEGLLAYCLGKPKPGWLAMSVEPYASAQEAQTAEQEGVALLGWRRDVRALKLGVSGQAKTLKSEGGDAWWTALLGLQERYSPLLNNPTPLSEGVLLNQTTPTRDGRGRGAALAE